jgi:hypothetical protein
VRTKVLRPHGAPGPDVHADESSVRGTQYPPSHCSVAVQYPPGSLQGSATLTTVVHAAGSSLRTIQCPLSHWRVSVQ